VWLGRYHYNVANTRVEQHVEKGNDDGLYISSVACCQELWALIMDAGTGFTAQVGLSALCCAPAVIRPWCRCRWSLPAKRGKVEEGFHGALLDLGD
jgi:hypothetical protein